MATANSSEYTEFFLDEEDGSGTSSNRDQYCKISPNITTERFSAFLQTLLKVYKPPSSENCILKLAMKAALDESKSALIKEFLQNILCLFDDCFSQAGVEKHSQKYAINLEVLFAEKRHSSFHHCAIKWSWERLFANTASQGSDYDQVSEKLLQQILQYFWSSSSNNSITVESPEKEGEMTIDLSAYDECDFTNIKDHAGWVVKRTRENLVEKLINANTIALQKGNILIDCLDKMASNKELREKWDQLSSKSDATSVIVLQRIVAFFIKSKQQILREKKGLKPHKSSVAIRQQLRLTTSKAISHHSCKNVMVNEEVNQLRSGDLTSVTINHFLNSLTIQSGSASAKILSKSCTGCSLSLLLILELFTSILVVFLNLLVDGLPESLAGRLSHILF